MLVVLVLVLWTLMVLTFTGRYQTSAPAANGQFSSYVDPGKWVNTHGANTEPQIATNTPTNLLLKCSTADFL